MKKTAILISAISLICLFGCNKGQKQGADIAPVDTRIPVKTSKVFLGQIVETTSVTGSITAFDDVLLSAKAAARIQNVYVKEGDAVAVGQVVVQQDPSDLIVQKQQTTAALQSAYAQLAQAKAAISSARSQVAQAKTNASYQPEQTNAAIANAQAQLNAARAKLAEVKAGARPQERQQAKNSVASAKANLDKARSDLSRNQKLADQGAISQSQLDSYQAAFDTAQAQYNSALEALNMMNEGSRTEDIQAAQDQVAQAQSALRIARAGKSQDIMKSQQVNSAKAGLAQAMGQAKSAQAAISSAKAQINIINKQIANLSIRSSISGVVAQKMAQPGQNGAPGTPLLRIVDLRSVFFEGSVSESAVSSFRPKQNVAVTSSAYPKRVFAGYVERVYPAANTTSRQFQVRIHITNSDISLKPGMFATGQIQIRKYVNVPLIPKDAIIQVGEKTWVYVLVGEKAHKRKIVVKYSNPQYALISGVTPSEQVIVQGQNGLQDGAVVKPM